MLLKEIQMLFIMKFKFLRTVATMAAAVQTIKASGKAIKTEASGNMSIPRLVEVAATGVDYISVGALTHTVKGMDISMNIQVEK